MREPYKDLYALFRHDTGAEAYFYSLPGYVQDQITARYKGVDSLARLQFYAEQAQRAPYSARFPAEEIGNKVFLPAPMRF